MKHGTHHFKASRWSLLLFQIRQIFHKSNYIHQRHFKHSVIINPRHACAVRVCLSVCVCPLSHISPLGLLFVMKMLPRTQQATKVKKFVAFFLKLFCCRDRAFPPLMAIQWVGHFSYREHACALLIRKFWSSV